MNKENIRARAILGLKLTERERSRFLLYLATIEEVKAFLDRERRGL